MNEDTKYSEGKKEKNGKLETIKNANHSYYNKEKELVNIIRNFL